MAKAALAGEKALAYSDLAERLGLPNPTGRGLGPILDEARAMCVEHGLPDVSCVIVTKATVETGSPEPSDGYIQFAGVGQEDLPAEQERDRTWDWTSVPSLQLDQE